MHEAQGLGVCEALIKSIKTLQDGSFSITFEVNPNDQELISQLMRRYALNERLITLGMAVANE